MNLTDNSLPEYLFIFYFLV